MRGGMCVPRVDERAHDERRQWLAKRKLTQDAQDGLLRKDRRGLDALTDGLPDLRQRSLHASRELTAARRSPARS